MAEGGKAERAALSWPNLLVTILIVWGVLTVRLGYESKRPAVGLKEPSPPAGPEDIPARLWQDPLGAVAEATAKGASGTQATNPFEVLPKKPPALGHADDREVVLMPVLINGDPYDEGVESRLQDRYAVLAAIGTAGYVPEDSEHIGYFTVPRPSDTRESLKVPFEWFHEFAPGDQKVLRSLLVIWVDETALDPRPLTELGRIAQVLDCLACQVDRPAPRGKIRTLGPFSSSTFLAIKAEPAPSDNLLPYMDRITFYSTWTESRSIPPSRPRLGSAAKSRIGRTGTGTVMPRGSRSATSSESTRTSPGRSRMS
jgi:hypothetical protein